MTVVAQTKLFQQARGIPIDTKALVRGIYTIIAQTPSLLGKTVEIPKELVFCPGMPVSAKEEPQVILEIENMEIRPRYAILLATDYRLVFWGCVIFTDPGLRMRDISDDHIFEDNELSETMVLEMSAVMRINVEERSVPPNTVTVGNMTWHKYHPSCGHRGHTMLD